MNNSYRCLWHNLQRDENLRQYHDAKAKGEAKEGHQMEGEKLKPVIFGGLDGILTSFAIVAGAAGGNLPVSTVLVLGFSNIFADALSMGVGEFLSSKAHSEWVLSERNREMWEMENYPDGEIQEMIDIYTEKGMGQEDAEMVVRTMARYKDFFVDIMMAQELELQLPDEDFKMESFKEGIVMFFSFAVFGSLPIFGYVIFPLIFGEMTTDELFKAACTVTGVVLFIMGCVKSNFSASPWYLSGLETLFLGGACATLAYVLGQYIDSLLGEGSKQL